MREDVQDKDPACPVVDARDQAIVVPFDVEDGSPSRHVCVGEIASNIREVPPLGAFRDSIPVHQGDVSISVSCRKAQDRRSADHPHTCSLQNENLRVKRQFPASPRMGAATKVPRAARSTKTNAWWTKGPCRGMPAWQCAPARRGATTARRFPCPGSCGRRPRGSSARSWRCTLRREAPERKPGRCRD